MELWFSDYQTEKVKVSVKVQKQLFGLQTEFQRIDVFDSDEFGRFLSADGSIVFSEKDEFIYDEMIVHVPMAVHPCVKNVLVIGGGDGGGGRTDHAVGAGAAERSGDVQRRDQKYAHPRCKALGGQGVPEPGVGVRCAGCLSGV